MSEKYNVFISWSGPRSRWIAEALHGWLPLIIQSAKPWMSANDIDKGARGLQEVTEKLQGMKVGITCLTRENLDAPWILYEAGALSKTIDERTRLCTLLLGGLTFTDVPPPLGMFQATKPEKTDIQKLLNTINHAVGEDIVPEANLNRLFERFWPDLDEKLRTMPESDAAASPPRSTGELLAELLELARADANRRKSADWIEQATQQSRPAFSTTVLMVQT
jgi:hypothetical protein